MTATAADIGYGTILKKGNADGPPETFTDFGLEITSVAAPGISRTAIDATHMQSPNSYKEMIYGMLTTKPFNLEFNWVPANTGDIKDAIEGDPGNWQILFPDNATVTFTGAFTDFDVAGLTPDGKMTGSATFTPTGQATWA
jgi:hypothetical protein